MMVALLIFLLGTKTYRFYILEDKKSVCKNWKNTPHSREEFGKPSSAHGRSHPTTSDGGGDTRAFMSDQSKIEEGDSVNAVQVEEAKGVFRLFSICATCLIYAVVFAQSSTFFTKQGSTLDRRISPRLQVPPAALHSFIGASIVCFIPIYDRIIVPTARKFSKGPPGFTLLQRIGIGMVLSTIAMVIAAVAEMKAQNCQRFRAC